MVAAATANGHVAKHGMQRTLRTISSGLNAGIAKPRVIPSGPREVGSVIDEAESFDHGTITQDGIARVFANRYADLLRFCHVLGNGMSGPAPIGRKTERRSRFILFACLVASFRKARPRPRAN